MFGFSDDKKVNLKDEELESVIERLVCALNKKMSLDITFLCDDFYMVIGYNTDIKGFYVRNPAFHVFENIEGVRKFLYVMYGLNRRTVVKVVQ